MNYGTGCSGSFGTPVLVGFSPPRLGRVLPLLTAGTRIGSIEFTVLG